MKRTISLLSMLAFVLAFSGNLFAQTQTSDNADITAEAAVVANITIDETQDVNFQQIAADITTNSPEIDPTTSPTHSNIEQGTPVVGYAQFTATAGQSITVTNPGAQTLINQNNGDYTITYNPNLCIQDGDASTNSCSDAGGVNTDVNISDLSSGTGTVFIGGTLTDPDNAGSETTNLENGTYSNSSVTISIDYTL